MDVWQEPDHQGTLGVFCVFLLGLGFAFSYTFYFKRIVDSLKVIRNDRGRFPQKYPLTEPQYDTPTGIAALGSSTELVQKAPVYSHAFAPVRVCAHVRASFCAVLSHAQVCVSRAAIAMPGAACCLL